MDIKLKKHREIYLILLSGELDLYNAPRLEKTFTLLLSKGAEGCVVDFTGTVYIDSSGVGTLLKLNSVAASKKIPFMLSGIHGEVLNVLNLTNLITFFPMENSCNDAIKKLVEQTENTKRSSSQ